MAAGETPVLDAAPGTNPAAAIDYRRFLDCVHCGLCTAACPTYLETGNENDSPRGRIYLMRAVADGRLEAEVEVQRHLDLCLDCRACETACPSGVQYGRLIEPFRVGLAKQSGRATDDWFQRRILFGLFPDRHRLARALVPARWAQALGLDRLARGLGITRLLPARLRQLVDLLPPLALPEPPLPKFLPAIGPRRARVALFLGCVGDAVFRPTNWATARVLQRNGCDVFVPAEQGCCGAIHFHSGHSEPARHLADANVQAFDMLGTSDLASVDAVIVNVAGCGSMLKDLAHHWHDDRQPARADLAGKVRDVCEFLDTLGLVPPTGSIPVTATYHDACHLVHAQRIREAPRRLLSRIPGLKLVPLAESELCCGAAGTYNLTEPEMAARLARRKLDHIRATGAELVITGNAGCQLQITREARQQKLAIRVVHPVDLLDQAYRSAE